MKTNILITPFLCLCLISCKKDRACVKDKDVPAVVRTAFTTAYPGIHASWEKEGELYEADFKKDNLDVSVFFDASGRLVRTEKEILVTEISQPIHNYVSQHYAGYKIDEAEQVTAEEVLSYKIEVEKGDDEKELFFSQDGTFIEEKTEQEDD